MHSYMKTIHSHGARWLFRSLRCQQMHTDNNSACLFSCSSPNKRGNLHFHSRVRSITSLPARCEGQKRSDTTERSKQHQLHLTDFTCDMYQFGISALEDNCIWNDAPYILLFQLHDVRQGENERNSQWQLLSHRGNTSREPSVIIRYASLKTHLSLWLFS